MSGIEYLSADSASEVKSADDFPYEWYQYVSEDHFWFRWRYAAFRRMIRELGFSGQERLLGLDIGCGNGLTCAQVERDSLWTLDGADLNRPALAQQHGGRGRTLFYDIHDRRAELRERYDFLILFDVLEHIDRPGLFLASALYHLKPGGWLFVNVPALESLRSDYDRAAGHVRRYNKPLMKTELGAAGLEVRDTRYWGFANVPLLLLRKLMLARAPRDKSEVIRAGFKPPNAAVNRLLRGIARMETALLRSPPCGSSLLAAARKRISAT